MTRINIDNPNINDVGPDAGGGEIIHFNGQPFTGIIEEIRNGILVGESEYKDGSANGRTRIFYITGELKEEYFDRFNYMYNYYKKWDINGNLLVHTTLSEKGRNLEIKGWNPQGVLIRHWERIDGEMVKHIP